MSSQEVTKIDVGSMTSKEIDLKMRELYQKVDQVWKYLACDYSTTNSSGPMRSHVETHLEGLSYTCTLCSKEFRYRNSLMCHKIIPIITGTKIFLINILSEDILVKLLNRKCEIFGIELTWT